MIISGFQQLLRLVKHLPLERWKPDLADIELIAGRLSRHPPSSMQSQCTREVISRMDWDNADLRSHQVIAIGIVEASIKFSTAAESKGYFEEGLKQVTRIIRTSEEQQFTEWSWSALSRLKLHLAEQPRDSNLFKEAVFGSNPGRATDRLIDFDLDPSFQKIVERVPAKDPLACYLTLQATGIGHNLQDVYQRGWKMLEVLCNHGRHDAVIRCLFNMTSMCSANPKELLDSEEFLAVFNAVVAADQSIIQSAKGLVTGDFPGPILASLGAMIDAQFEYFTR